MSNPRTELLGRGRIILRLISFASSAVKARSIKVKWCRNLDYHASYPIRQPFVDWLPCLRGTLPFPRCFSSGTTCTLTDLAYFLRIGQGMTLCIGRVVLFQSTHRRDNHRKWKRLGQTEWNTQAIRALQCMKGGIPLDMTMELINES
jgi:hypothetical protein